MDLLKIGLVSDKLDAYSLRDQADWVMKPALLAVPGVAHVIVFGGAVRQIQIQPDLAADDVLWLDPDRSCRCRAGGAGAARRRFYRSGASAGADPDAGSDARSRRRSPVRCWRCAAGRPSPSAMSPP